MVLQKQNRVKIHYVQPENKRAFSTLTKQETSANVPCNGGRAAGVFSSAVSSVFEEKGLYEGYHITELLSRGINFLML